MPLPESTRPRRIGVSAFGYGGTNSHAVLEEFGLGSPGRPRHKGIRTLQGVSRPLDGADSYDDGRSHLLLISAHDEATLRNNIQDLLSTAQTANLLDLAYTLGVRRTKLPERAFIVAHKDRTKVEIRIENTRISSPKNPPVIGLVFTGSLHILSSQRALAYANWSLSRSRGTMARNGSRIAEGFPFHVAEHPEA